ncbi:unnamed protein product [Gongylonema pulchrum]|uniref:Uncharacterized protein n=1 Tax=Gongylonema pulchrum TaxID=637853 RepID=A0A3P7QCI9_9BILA|nr:unnamed protein product [Gongylonema pulchrum]
MQHSFPQLVAPATSSTPALSRFATAQSSFYATSTTNATNLISKDDKFKPDPQGYCSTATAHPLNSGGHPQQAAGFSLQTYQYNGPL